MTIAGDTDEIEVGFDTGTADSDNAAEAARRIAASNAKPARDVDDPFKPYPNNLTLNDLMIGSREKTSKNFFVPSPDLLAS
jgi:hypothetical protein